ncbi:MAG: response regulator [Lachnospiraceae bacterium]|nr:response regulator [Lachnospiraceae bacterium]
MPENFNKSKQGIFDTVIRILIGICTLFALFLYIYGQFFVRNESMFASKCESFETEWAYTDPSGVTNTYGATESFDIKDVESIKLTSKLPEKIKDGYCLFVLTSKDMDVFIGDDLRNSYRISHSIFGRNVKGMWLPVTLRSGDAGKTITMIQSNYGKDTYKIHKMYLANRLGFAAHLISVNIIILTLGFATILFGGASLLICLVMRIRLRRGFPLWYLSLGIFGAAWWIIFDNPVYPFFFQNYFIDGIMEYVVQILLPFPFAAYVHTLYKEKYKRLFYTISILTILSFVSICTLHFTDLVPFNEAMPVIDVFLLIAAVYCFGVIAYESLVKKNRENYDVSFGFAFFAVFAVCEIIHLNLPVHQNDCLFVAVGLLVLLSFAVLHEIRRINAMRKETLQAQSANEAKTTFLANMSHEIRTPINAILGMDELILHEDTDVKVREYALNIKSAGNSLLEIISDVLDFAKIEQGKMDIFESGYETKTLINSIITMISVKTDEKGLSFVKNISEKLPSGFWGDEKRIREVMINLLSNAVKYTPGGSISLSIDHEMNNDKNAVLYIEIKDTGIGIKESDMNRLFKQFERLDHNKTRSIEGTGLGLAIAANLVKLMNGTIECESKYGEGTKFTVRIPQIVTDAAPIGDITNADAGALVKSRNKELHDFSGVKVLVVDDNNLNLKVAVGLLGVLKASVTKCTSGFEMLDHIKKEKFDIVLLDHMMPEMDGIEALRNAKRLAGNPNEKTPYIALTANAIAGAKQMYLEHGFSDYLSKPMKIEELSDVLYNILNK